MSLQALTNKASVLVGRQTTLTPSLLKDIDALKRQAALEGVAAQFDTALRVLFKDKFETQGTPPPPTEKAGHAHNLASGGVKGAALQFFTSKDALKDPAALGATVAKRVPELRTTTALPVPLEQQFPPLTAEQQRAANSALQAELSSLMVRGPGGARVKVLDKLLAHPGLSDVQKERVLGALAQVKRGYLTAGALLDGKPGGVTYQDVNWKHTRLELDRVLDVALAKGLSPKDTETALLASIFSDSVKTPGNFVVHNVHGAQAALHVLARDQPPLSADQLEDIARVALEHQIGPPKFMALVAMSGALKAQGVSPELVGSIAAKIAAPLDAKHQTSDRSKLAFTDAERGALEKVGVFSWTVPQVGSRHEAASRAVIDADSLVNYACPDGWAKIAALHGPNQPVFLQEPLLIHSLTSEAPQHASAKKSWADARSVISAETAPLYEAGQGRTTAAIDSVLHDLERWVAQLPKGDVPLTKDGNIPYLTGALDYGDARQLAFAERLRDQAVTLLRQQEAPP